ncbi:MAG: ATP-binding cassette domain-containing protein [Candidatus Wallbacteria bacterium]|nr:ATP-binding cassette domain-containing protein [Candidatus Wallbacteria bacterium]
MAPETGPESEETVIRLENVSKSFGRQAVLRDVSFHVQRGETFAVVGPSGCGKSVTLKVIVGLLRPDAGKVTVFGQDVTHASEAAFDILRKRMAMVFQSGALFDSMTVGENVSFPLDQHTATPLAEKRRIVAESLSRVGLPGTEAKMPSELSGGMRKRVAVARALALAPELILFDEPTTGLDPITTTEIGLLIRRLRDDLGLTSVMVSHDIKNVMEFANRLGIHHGGELIAVGTPDEIRQSRHPFVRQFLEGLAHPPQELAA